MDYNRLGTQKVVGAPAVTALLVGFDSAWTSTNSGALVGAIQLDDGTFHGLGTPKIADYPEAEGVIFSWQAKYAPTATIVLLDQPTIVKNAGANVLSRTLLGRRSASGTAGCSRPTPAGKGCLGMRHRCGRS